MSENVSQLECCYTNEFQQCTLKPELITAVREKIVEIIESFIALKFEVFDPINVHHWKLFMQWFEREVRFLDAESAKLSDEIFHHLVSSRLAIKALKSMKEKNYRRVVGNRFLDKVGLIIRKFEKEIAMAEKTFRRERAAPKIKEDLPPISGAICWSKEIGDELTETLKNLEVVEEVRKNEAWNSIVKYYNNFQAELMQHRNECYNEWRSKVSDVLNENLTRNLLLKAEPKKGMLVCLIITIQCHACMYY